MEETRKQIMVEELEEIMASKEGMFDVESVDTYGFSISMLCRGCHFDKDMDGGYISIVLLCRCGEVQIDPSSIEKIYIDEDGMIEIEFGIDLPDLELRYREG